MHILAGKHYKRKLIVPKGVTLRPTFSRLKATLFNILQSEIEGAYFLDLFAGIGGMGVEALSRGAKGVTFVEKERKAMEEIKANCVLVKEEENVEMLLMDVFSALKWLEKKGEQFDIIFADPPYGTREKSLSDEVLVL